MLEEFKKFALRGNVIDMAVGIIIGGAFGTIVKSMVNDVIMPPVGLLLGGVDFANFFAVLKEGGEAAGPYNALTDAQAAGAVTVNYGLFINAVISFLIVAFCVFLLVKAMNKAQERMEGEKEEAPPDTKDCPFCLSSIAIKATRCPNCTSEVQAA
jgi:large conductance mechanosensitive channel